MEENREDHKKFRNHVSDFVVWMYCEKVHTFKEVWK